MKRLFVVLITVLALVCLCSCLTLVDELTDRNVYSTHTYSSKYGKEPISKDGTIVVYVNVNDYGFQRPFELEIKKMLEKEGFKVEVMSDYNYTSNQFFDVLYSLNAKYLFEVSFVSGSLYTYENGGGISRISFEVNVFDEETYEEIMKMSSSASGTSNRFEGFVSSQETVSVKLSRDIAQEFCKYL